MTSTASAFTLADLEAARDRHWPRMEALLQEVVAPGRPYGTLEDMTWYHLQTGGKRLRAVIPCCVLDSVGGRAEDAIPLGAAIEMLHNATLVHDDLQDGDTHRRGVPTVWVRYGAPQAINCGDAMFYYTLQLVQRLDRPADVVGRLVSMALANTIEVIRGQVDEFRIKEHEAPGVEAYLSVVRGKTSGLFELPIAGGAVLAGLPDELVDRLRVIAGELGVLFQAQDDVLDIVGNKGRDRRGTDIAEGKISLLAAHCLHQAPTDAAAELQAILRKPRGETTETDITRAIELYQVHGSLAFARRFLEERQEAIAAHSAELDRPALSSLLVGLADVFLAPIRS